MRAENGKSLVTDKERSGSLGSLANNINFSQTTAKGNVIYFVYSHASGAFICYIVAPNPVQGSVDKQCNKNSEMQWHS